MVRTDTMHEVVNRFIQALRKSVVVAAGWIFMLQVVLCKLTHRRCYDLDVIFLGVFPHVAVNGGGELVPEGGLDEPLVEQLTYDLK